MSKLPEKLNEFVEESRYLDEMMRNMYLLEYAKKLGEYPDDEMDDDHKVRGCTSTVYIRADCVEGKMQYEGWSDAQIVRGMVSVLVNSLSGETADRIVEIPPDFIEESGVAEVLTNTRQSGFYNIFRRLQREAAIHASSSESAVPPS